MSDRSNRGGLAYRAVQRVPTRPGKDWRVWTMFRRGSILAAAASLLLTLAWSTSALASAEHRTVQMLDACDGPSFNAVIGDGACSRAGGGTFDQLICALRAHSSAA